MKSSRFNFGRALSLLCAIFFVSFSFISCQQEEDTEIIYPRSVYDLQGTWSASYETYDIDFRTNTFDAGLYSYAGNNMVVRFVGTDYGYIYIKYTKAYEFTSEDKSSDSTWFSTKWPSEGYYRYSTTAPDVGRWYAIAFRNLKDSSLDLSGAYGEVTSTSSLEEAISTFTIDNGYFAGYSTLNKE